MGTIKRAPTSNPHVELVCDGALLPPLPYEGLDDDLRWQDGRRKMRQKHNQGGHCNVWDKKETEGKRVRV